MLLTCPECGKSFSHTAGACPVCSWTPTNDPEFFLQISKHFLFEKHDTGEAFAFAWKALEINSEHQGALALAFLSLAIGGNDSSDAVNLRQNLINKIYQLNPNLANELTSVVNNLHSEPSFGERIWKSLFG